jgi:hypothetical protein
MLLLALIASFVAHATPDGAVPADGKYALPGSGFTLAAPGWHMSRWSDWDFKGRSPDGSVFVTTWSSSFQLTIDEAAARALADHWKRGLEESEGATDVQISEVRVEDVGGKPRARATLSFMSGGGIKGVCHAAAFSTEGLTAQLYTITAAPLRERGAAALERLLEGIEVTRPPADTTALGSLTTPFGTVSLPPGWRAPLNGEGSEVSALYGRTGAKDAKACTAAIHPRVGGEADLVLACPEETHPPIIDEASFADESILFAREMFGAAAAKLRPPVAIPRGDESAVLLHANDGLWVGGLSVRTGMQVVWASGDPTRDGELETVIRSVLTEFKLAPEAEPDRSFGVLLMHRLTYDPTHPMVLLPGLVLAAIAAFIIRMILRSPAGRSDEDPTLPE